MRPRSARLPPAYRPLNTTTNSSRVAMLTRLMPTTAPAKSQGANQMRQQLTMGEHFRRGNAPSRVALSIEGSAASVALDVHLQDGGVVNETVDGGERHGLITEH